MNDFGEASFGAFNKLPEKLPKIEVINTITKIGLTIPTN
jgi:hypothetical protein